MLLRMLILCYLSSKARSFSQTSIRVSRKYTWCIPKHPNVCHSWRYDSKWNAPFSSSLMASSSSNEIRSKVISEKLVSNKNDLGVIGSNVTRMLMLAYIASMCVALPVTLAPAALLHKMKIIEKKQREHISLRTGQFCARWLLRVFPFAKVSVVKSNDNPEEEATVWVCNHTSMLDIFFLMATSKKLRGKKARPIKIIYWKPLEANPVNRIFFRSCGFIPVEMAANKAGEVNEYDRKSFKLLLKMCKDAFNEGFDIGIIPEGQLNPNPEAGLQPVFSGAYTLAKMSKRPIRMIALHGLHKLWHPDESIGMKCSNRNVKIRAYPKGKVFQSSDDFKETFSKVVGHFGAIGEDMPTIELRKLLYNDYHRDSPSSVNQVSRADALKQTEDDIESWLTSLVSNDNKGSALLNL